MASAGVLWKLTTRISQRSNTNSWNENVKWQRTKQLSQSWKTKKEKTNNCFSFGSAGVARMTTIADTRRLGTERPSRSVSFAFLPRGGVVALFAGPVRPLFFLFIFRSSPHERAHSMTKLLLSTPTLWRKLTSRIRGCISFPCESPWQRGLTRASHVTELTERDALKRVRATRTGTNVKFLPFDRRRYFRSNSFIFLVFFIDANFFFKENGVTLTKDVLEFIDFLVAYI